MPKTVVIDEIHLTVSVPSRLRRGEYRSIRRTLKGASFHTKLSHTVREVFHRHPSLNKVRITLTH